MIQNNLQWPKVTHKVQKRPFETKNKKKDKNKLNDQNDYNNQNIPKKMFYDQKWTEMSQNDLKLL